MRALAAPLVLLLLLAAGCADPVVRPGLRANAETREVPASAAYPGLVVRGTMSATAEHLLVTATAHNGGSQTYVVATGCASAWAQYLYRGADMVPFEEPVEPCAGSDIEFVPFPPGATRHFNATWDGLVWSGAAKQMVAASPGIYEWSIRFSASPADGDAVMAKRFDLNFNVTVLD